MNEEEALKQQIQYLEAQKQAYLIQQKEVENAFKEVSESSGAVYKYVGGVLVQKPKEEVLKALEEEKTIIKSRITIIEKQEEKLKNAANSKT
jgi:prefoldin beta subunit